MHDDGLFRPPSVPETTRAVGRPRTPVCTMRAAAQVLALLAASIAGLASTPSYAHENASVRPAADQSGPRPFPLPEGVQLSKPSAKAAVTEADATLSCAASCSGVFCIEPYLQSLLFDEAASTNSVKIVFQTNGPPSQTPIVSYVQGDCSSFSQPMQIHASPYTITGGPANVYHATLTSLEPGKPYCYQATVGGAGGTRRAFTTLEAPPSTFSFYVYGDTRAGSACYTSNPAHQSVVAAMSDPAALEGVRFILNSGDFVYSGNCQRDWTTQFFDQAGPMLAGLPIFTAPGNHEYYDCAQGHHCTISGCTRNTQGTYYESYFTTPNNSSFDYGNARFISLDLTLTEGTSGDNSDRLPSGTVSWLTTTLANAESDIGIDHVFLFYHAPMLTLGASHNEHPCSDWQIQNLAPLYEKSSKVRAIFNGHTHYYQRSKKLSGVRLQSGQTCAAADTPIVYTDNPGGGVSYVVAGAGGAGPSTPGSANWVASETTEHGFLKVTISGRDAYAQQIGTGSFRDPFPLALGITGGVEHNCVLTETGGVQCWGSNQWGQIGNDSTISPQTVPTSVVDASRDAISGMGQVAAGEYHTCAVSAASYSVGVDEYLGTVLCWGFNGSGQIGNGTSGGSVRAASRVLANSSGAPLSAATQVAGGWSSTCARLADGTARCWGNAQFGQLGNGINAEQPFPYPVTVIDAGGQALGDIAQVAVGQYHACALMNGGTVSCWGDNASGQLGYATGTATWSGVASPVVLEANTPLTDISGISASAYNTCAIKTDGTAWCWGLNTFGRLGGGSGGVVPAQVAGINTAVGLATNWTSTCALQQAVSSDSASNSAWCWGSNAKGQLGNATAGGGSPTQVGTLTGLTALGVSAYGGCAIDNQSQVWCWGDDSFGQLGNGTAGGTSTVPVTATVSLTQ